MGGGASIPIPQEFIELDDEGQKAFAKEFEALTTSDTPDVVPFSPRTALDKLYRAELTRRSGADPVTTDPMVIADAVMKLAEMDAEQGIVDTPKPEVVIEGGCTLIIDLVQLTETIDKVVAAGFTPMLVDDSEDNKVDTFFSYRSVSVLDGKKLGLDKSMRGVSLEECMEEARDRLVSALKYGNLLMIAMMGSVTDFNTTFTDECELCQNPDSGLDFSNNKAYFPQEVFRNAGKNLVKDEWIERLFRDKDREDTNGIAVARAPDEFRVILSTRFSPEDFEEYFFSNEWGLCRPKEQYVFVIIDHQNK